MSQLDNNREALLDYFQQVFGNRPRERSYLRLIREQGEWFNLHGEHPRLGTGPMRFCFMNAYHAARKHHTEFTYVEGFALAETGLPMHHAWVEDQQHRAWDVTWEWEHPTEGALLGLRVPLVALNGHWRTCGGASFLADYYHDFPAVRVAPIEWRTRLPLLLGEIRSQHCLAEVKAGRATIERGGAIRHKDMQ